jgi:ferredoxin-type protein NapH
VDFTPFFSFFESLFIAPQSALSWIWFAIYFLTLLVLFFARRPQGVSLREFLFPSRVYHSHSFHQDLFSFCSWACWTSMVLDLLPFEKSPGRRLHLQKWRWIHLAVSFGTVALLYFVFHWRFEREGTPLEFYLMLSGNILYYVLAIGMAFWFKDNRAFCKYACPIPTVQKLTSPYSIFKLKIDPQSCIRCGLCEQACPTDVKLLSYLDKGLRISPMECITANRCIEVCPTYAVTYSIGFDAIREEHLIEQKTQ